MFTGSLRLGRIVGIDVNVHWSVMVIAFVLGFGLSETLGWMIAAIGVTAFLLSILVHEFAHALVARHYGVQTRSIELWALGGVARLDREAPSPRAEGLIAAAGPMASLAASAVSLAVWALLGGGGAGGDSDRDVVAMFGWLGLVNAILAIFNLLPGAPLDGGRIVRAVRWARHGDRFRAWREAARAGTVLGWSIVGLGLWLTFSGAPGLFLVITGAFIALSARAEIAASDFSERLAGTTVHDLTWYGLAHAPASTDVATMLSERQRMGSAGAVLAVSPDGTPVGVVLEDALWATTPERRSSVTLADLAPPLDTEVRMSPDDDLTAVIGRLTPDRPLVTVWEHDRLVGVIPPDTLELRLRSAQVAA